MLKISREKSTREGGRMKGELQCNYWAAWEPLDVDHVFKVERHSSGCGFFPVMLSKMSGEVDNQGLGRHRCKGIKYNCR